MAPVIGDDYGDGKGAGWGVGVIRRGTRAYGAVSVVLVVREERGAQVAWCGPGILLKNALAGSH